jgi:hypothetical protein
MGFTTLFCPFFNRSMALSTARLVSEVRRIFCFGSFLMCCQIISAIAVDLPVPGGP